MRKFILITFAVLIIILTAVLSFLSNSGIKTNKFNNLIVEKVKTFNPSLNIEINDVYLKLNISDRSIKISTADTIVNLSNNNLTFDNIIVDLDLINFLRGNNTVSRVTLDLKKSSTKDITNFINAYSFNFSRFIIFNQIEKGDLTASISVTPDEKNLSKYTYEILGNLQNATINILNKKKFTNINSNFEIINETVKLKKLSFVQDKINFFSNEINIKKISDNYKFNGDLGTSRVNLSSDQIGSLLNLNLNFLSNNQIEVKTINLFSFTLDDKIKINDLNLNSEIFYDKIDFQNNYLNLISLKQGKIELSYKNEILDLKLDSVYKINNDLSKNDKNDKIQINISKRKNEDFKAEVFFTNKLNTINFSEINKSIPFKQHITIQNQDITFASQNKINFDIDQSSKIKNLQIDSSIEVDELSIKFKSSRAQKYLKNIKDQIKLTNNIIKFKYKKNDFIFEINGNYLIEKNKEKFYVNLSQNNDKIFFKSEIDLKDIEIDIEPIEFSKNKGQYGNIKLDGYYNKKNKEVYFKNINFEESKNIIQINNLYILKNDKIKFLENIKINIKNNHSKLNNLEFFKKGDSYVLKSSSYDGAKLIDGIIKSQSNSSIFKLFSNFSNNIILDLDKFYIDNLSNIKNLNGDVKVENNKISYVALKGLLNNKRQISLNIKLNSQKEKTTNLFIERPEPFIKKYKFIKGFKEGSLSLDSVEKNGLSRSKLKIYDFKIQEVPILAKILTLASLQGIADILTGEGIRFNEFEMDYKTSGVQTTIEEMYAIGPSISILMEGYIIKNGVTSLRGTLVPATTINKTIAKIPLVGNILVGKKVGEGVFGVSFKIKGMPKKLKTTVNPVKTLTPRFITRTLEKIKRN